MLKHNKIFGHDIDKLSADELCDKIGISRFENDQLLEVFRESLDNMHFAFKHGDNFKRECAYLEAGPSAYLIYNRLYEKKGFIFKHPSLKEDYPQNSIHFWSDPVAIELLFIKLVDDGYCKLKPHKMEEVYG